MGGQWELQAAGFKGVEQWADPFLFSTLPKVSLLESRKEERICRIVGSVFCLSF